MKNGIINDKMLIFLGKVMVYRKFVFWLMIENPNLPPTKVFLLLTGGPDGLKLKLKGA